MSDEPSHDSSSHKGGKKLGPFPVTVWVGILGGGLVLGLVARHFTKSSPAPATVDPNADATGIAAVRLVADPGGSGAGTTPTGKPTTNLVWGQMAVEYLIGSGQDPALSQRAIGLFLEGQAVTAQEQALISAAIRALGPPPESTPPVQVVPPKDPPGPPPIPTPPGAVDRVPHTTPAAADGRGIQTKLNKLRNVQKLGGADKVANWPELTIDGNLSSPSSVQAIKAFQTVRNESAAKNGDPTSPVSGVMDSATLAFLDQSLAFFKL